VHRRWLRLLLLPLLLLLLLLPNIRPHTVV
jgi:hypothetical protein